MNQFFYLLCCYLLGSIPTGYLAGRLLRGIDIRKEGSGNVGATNVLRVLGKGPGAVVLIIDICKGVIAVALLPHYFALGSAWLLAGALAAVLGHNYTCFLRFKGGKGVATSAGVCIGLAPHTMLGVVVIFVVLVLVSRMVSVASLGASAALAPLAWYYAELGAIPPKPGQFFYLALLLTIFIWLRHIPNIRRILAGTENTLWKKRA